MDRPILHRPNRYVCGRARNPATITDPDDRQQPDSGGSPQPGATRADFLERMARQMLLWGGNQRHRGPIRGPERPRNLSHAQTAETHRNQERNSRNRAIFRS